MALLVLDGVSKHSSAGRGVPRQRFALRDVSFELDASELVAVWGLPRSGRSTLLRVAGGVVPPSAGVVRFDGRDLVATPALGRRNGIALVNTCFRRVIGDSVLEHVAAPFMGRGMSVLAAESKAIQVLRRVDAVACAELDAEDLDHTEAIRVGIARALATDPRLLLVDEPTIGVPPARDRDDILALLRSIARRDRIAVLMTVGEAADLAGVDRALTIENGTLRGPLRSEPGRVIELRPEDGVTLDIDAGEMVALYGPSGSGKTTLLMLAAALMRPDRGTVRFAGRSLGELSDGEASDYRLRDVGVVFQHFELMRGVPAVENAAIKLLAEPMGIGEARRRAAPWLERVGLGHRLEAVPEQLSGGERQRVAIARALANEPRLILADEPTGSLDTQRGREVLSLLREIARERRTPVLVVTHDPQAAQIADRVHTLRDGKIEERAESTLPFADRTTSGA